MDDIHIDMKHTLKTAVKMVLWIIALMLIIALIFLGGAFIVYHYLDSFGLYPMDFIDSNALVVFIEIIIVMIYIVVFLIEGALIGFVFGVYKEIRRVVKKYEIFKLAHRKVIIRIYEDMKGTAYLGAKDFEKHKGRERIGFKEAKIKMEELIDDLCASGGHDLIGLVTSPGKWVTLRFTCSIMKRVGRFVIERMKQRDKQGEYVILMDELKKASEMDVWRFLRYYILLPMIKFAVVGTLLFLTMVLLPVVILNVLESVI